MKTAQAASARRIRRGATALIGAAATIALVGACSTDSANTGSSEELTTTAPAVTTTAAPAQPTLDDAQKERLCTDLEAQLSNWRVQGPTIGRGGLNILVQTWAAQSGVINLQVVQNRALVDEVASETCPQVRDDAIAALDIPDLASGLVGF